MLVLKRRERVLIQTKSIYLGEGKECSLLLWKKVCITRSFRKWRCFHPSGEKCKKVKEKSRGEETSSCSRTGQSGRFVQSWPGLHFSCLFFLSFQTHGFFSFYKPRCLVYKDQRDCTDINIKLMAPLYHSTCSGLTDEYTRVHGTAKPSKAILPSTQTLHCVQNSTVHMHRREKGFCKEKLTLPPTKADAVARVS